MNFENLVLGDFQFVLSLMTWVIFLGAFLWGGKTLIRGVWETPRVIRAMFVGLPRQFRGEKMVERARKVGKIAVCNTEKGIVAVCSSHVFQQELITEHHLICFEEDEDKQLRMFASSVMLLPPNTFTFADEEDGNLYVTGTRRDMDCILEDLILRVTGYSRRQVGRNAYDMARSLLVVKDKRLIVPFVREGVLPNGRHMPSLSEQVRSYGSRHLQEARRHILGLV